MKRQESKQSQNSVDFDNSSLKSKPTAEVLESVKTVQREIEKKLANRTETQGREWEIQKAAEEVLENILWAQSARMSQSDSRVAPIPTPRRQQQYLPSSQITQLQEDNLPVIYNVSGSIKDISMKPRKNKDKSTMDTPSSQILIAIQIGLIILYGLFVSYDEHVTAKPRAMNVTKTATNNNKNTNNNNYNNDFFNNANKNSPQNPNTNNQPEQNLHDFYYMFQDVHVMIFIGFGFLMTFLKKYGYSAVGYNLLIAAIAIQWSVLCRGLFHHTGSSIPIDITTLINGDFAAAAVLITFGAILGVSNPLQLVALCLIEVFLYALNEYIGAELFKAIDIGGSMYIHTFGAYFGLALSLTMRQQKDITSTNEEASKTSDLFAMIGTVFLWMFWPSFNGAMASGDDQHRAVINTVLSLTGSCIFSFAISALVSGENKFNMVHVQNASLAGGVAVGAVADLMIKPFGALLIGSLAGVLSVVGYTYITPFLQKKIGLHDTCGVHNLHGMPGIMAGLIGAVMAAIATENDYGNGLYTQYPARAPLESSPELIELRKDLVGIEPGMNRTASQQAIYQLAALGVTLVIALIGGACTGLLMRIPVFGRVPDDVLFDDSRLWEVPPEEEKPPQSNIGETHNGVSNQTFEMSPGTEKNEF